MTATPANGIETEPIIPTAVLREIYTQQRQSWLAARARFLTSMDVQMTIARELSIDKTAIVKDLESQLAECVIALRVLDAKIAELSDGTPATP